MSAYKRMCLAREQRDHAAARAAETESAETTTTEPPMRPHRSLVVHPNQQPLFPIRVVMCDTPESFGAFMEAELEHTKAWCKEQARLNKLRDIADNYVPKQLIVLPPAAE